MKWVSILILVLGVSSLYSQASISATYNTGDIPTSFDVYDPTCNGPLTTLSITLPATPGNYEITGIDISYDMTANTPGWMSDQRSQIFFTNNATLESSVYQGTGDLAGTFNYSRTNVDIANGDYGPGTNLIFEMRAWRVIYDGGGCWTGANKVDNLTWTITVYYNLCPPADVVLATQAEVNTFGSDLASAYANCQYISGSLTIGDAAPTDISDISTIASALDSVCNTLNINNNPLLSSFDFLVLEKVGILNVFDNATLSTMGFGVLDQLTLGSQIYSNPKLTQVLFPLVTEAISIIIENNDVLSSVQFPTLTNIGSIYVGAGFISPGWTNPVITLIDIPLLAESGSIYFDTGLISNFSFPGLTSFSSLNIEGANITDFSLPVLVDGASIELYGMALLTSLNMPLLESVTSLKLDAHSVNYGIYNDNTSLIQLDDLRQLKFATEIDIRNFTNFDDCCFLVNFYPLVCSDIYLSNGSNCSSWKNAIISCGTLDSDKDNYIASEDNCPNDYNPNQSDNDGDGIGNACDNCPLISNINQADTNNNFIGDACEVAEPGKSGINTTSPKSGLEISASELFLSDNSRGLIMTNAQGDCFRVIIDLQGELQVKPITCPN